MVESNDHAAAIATAAAVALALDIERARARLENMEHRLSVLEEARISAERKLFSIEAAANKWRGGFLLVVAMGSVVAWLVSVSSNIVKFIKG